MAKHRAGELGEEALDKVEPGTMRRREGELKAAGGLLGEPSLGRNVPVGRRIEVSAGRVNQSDSSEVWDSCPLARVCRLPGARTINAGHLPDVC